MPELLPVDIAQVCFKKGVIPSTTDIDELSSIIEGRLEEVGYHKIIDDTVREYFRKDTPQMSLFKETA